MSDVIPSVSVERPLRVAVLRIMGFRNLGMIEIEPVAGANLFVGDNGQGKTSLLEALDYVSTLRSFRGATRTQLVGHGQSQADMFVRTDEGSSLSHEFRVGITRASRDFSLDGKRPERAVQYYGSAACVVFHPQDLDLIRAGPELRRRLLDRILVRVLDGYGEALRSYVRTLRGRNVLLREPRPDVRALMAFDTPLARYGSAIVRARTQLANELGPVAQRSAAEVAIDDNAVALTYRPRAPDSATAFVEELTRTRDRDLARGATTVGPHGDDVSILWNDRPARTEASQGQTRALALALRIAELHLITQRSGRVPWLLLDDVSSELDHTRTEKLFSLVARLGAQVWITTTDPAVSRLIPHAALFRVRAGTVVREKPGLSEV